MPYSENIEKRTRQFCFSEVFCQLMLKCAIFAVMLYGAFKKLLTRNVIFVSLEKLPPPPRRPPPPVLVWPLAKYFVKSSGQSKLRTWKEKTKQKECPKMSKVFSTKRRMDGNFPCTWSPMILDCCCVLLIGESCLFLWANIKCKPQFWNTLERWWSLRLVRWDYHSIKLNFLMT